MMQKAICTRIDMTSLFAEMQKNPGKQGGKKIENTRGKYIYIHIQKFGGGQCFFLLGVCGTNVHKERFQICIGLGKLLGIGAGCGIDWRGLFPRNIKAYMFVCSDG